MLGPFKALIEGNKKTIDYAGNRIFKKIRDVNNVEINEEYIERRIRNLAYPGRVWKSLVEINNTIYSSVAEYFKKKLRAKYVLVPLTSRMISSPGAVYGKEKLDYTQDTIPIKLKWFNEGSTFLTESSQLYLELYLLIDGIDHVFTINNSFRKELADFVHLPEFRHVEYEGHVSQTENEDIISGLLMKIIKNILMLNEEHLRTFLTKEDIRDLDNLTRSYGFKKIEFKKTLEILYNLTGDKKYLKFTSKYWGSWEEAFVSGYFNKILVVKEFPLLEVAFYHHAKGKVYDENSGKYVWIADNADFIFPNYKEIVGSGYRVDNIKELKWKAKLFNLPKKDYEPYFKSRTHPNYKPSSGFGLGWERLLHALLRMPTIVDVCYIPRIHSTSHP